MNERIKALADRVIDSLDEDPIRITTRIESMCPGFIEKFAELVAKYVVKRVADLVAIDVNGEIAKTVIQEFSVPL